MIIITKHGKQVIRPDFEPYFAHPAEPIFKTIESIFDSWYSHATRPGAPMWREIRDCYEGWDESGPVFSKAEAVRQGIEILLEEAREAGLRIVRERDIERMDIETAFEI